MSLTLWCELLRSGHVTLVITDGAEVDTPEALLAHFARRRMKTFSLSE